MNKRRLHHLWTRFRRVKPAYFLAVAVLSGTIAVLALRANNQQMIKLRDAVYAADKSGADVQVPLRELQAYVTSHMNTDLTAGRNAVYPPVQLKYTYERLVKAQNDKFLNSDSELYNEAQRICEQQNPTDFSGRNRVPCIQQYVMSRTSEKASTIPGALYKFSFVSPRWSPDLAGWSLLVAILAGTAFVATFIADRWFKRKLK